MRERERERERGEALNRNCSGDYNFECSAKTFGKTPRGPRCARQARQRLASDYEHYIVPFRELVAAVIPDPATRARLEAYASLSFR